jgi:hypothetical protein
MKLHCLQSGSQTHTYSSMIQLSNASIEMFRSSKRTLDQIALQLVFKSNTNIVHRGVNMTAPAGVAHFKLMMIVNPLIHMECGELF